MTKEINDKLDKLIEFFVTELSSLRSNRAAPSLVENIKVDYYGTKTPLIQLASISAPETKIIIIQPWDKNSLKEIEKAISAADLGLNPVNEGSQIRLVFPPMTEERRKELVKIINQKAEETKMKVKNAREEEVKNSKKQKTDGLISEDDFYRHQEELQKIIDEYNQKIKNLAEEKEKELLTI